GQRFIPDSYMFYKLVYPNTSQFFPRGLHVMAVLGSDRAQEILDTVYQDTKDEAFVSQLTMLKKEFAGMNENRWAKNLYWNWLYALMPLLEEKGEGFPLFMQNQAWADKDLATALGSWAELRHDTILYAKQSYSLRGMAPAFKYGMEYVEPNPWIFARLASLANYMIDGLEGFNLLHEDFASRLQTFHSTALILKEAAERELLNQPLTTQQKWAIRNIGPTLMEMTTFYDGQSMGEAVDEPDSMAVIADVHTDINSGKVLEVGVGYPLNLYVIVGAGDDLNVMVGSAFSYYEFKHPMDDRLTDEAWNKMLEKGAQPVQEPWMDSYLIADKSFDRSTNPFFEPKKITEGISIEWVAQFGNTFIFRVDIAHMSSYQREKFRNASPQLELTVGDKIFTHSLQPDTTTANPHDYTAQFRVDASGKQKIEATVFSRQNLDIFHHTQFQPQQNSSFGSTWLLFE
ncbi:DUF3160 domain-containing protein, partial [bacterium]|nr:DUF3160 domain-containing protein [bacterium]